MQHARLVIHRLHIDGVEMPVRLATLVAVRRHDDTVAADGPVSTVDDGGDDRAEAEGARDDGIDWEVVADGVHDMAHELGRRHVEMLCITGADAEGHLILGELSGDAIMVRFVDRTVVLRGDGPLAGLTPDMFQA